MPTQTTPFADLRWEDLETWVGPVILARGRNYRHRVQDLAVTEDWQLIAKVAGSRHYVTRVWLADGKPVCLCNCPYPGSCKHAVAVVLAHLDGVQSNAPTPLIEADELEARMAAWGLTSESESEREADLRRGRAALDAMSKQQLIDWVMGLAADHSRVLEALPLTSSEDDEALAEAVARLHRKIRKAGDEGGSWNPWTDEVFLPDYAPIEKGLRTLLDGGHVEAVLELGEEVFEHSTAEVGMWDEEGTIASELSSCLAVVVEAMGKSQRPAPERLIWYWEKLLRDEYNLLLEVPPLEGSGKMSPKDWREVADEFVGRLVSSRSPQKSEPSFSDKYRRNRLLEFATEALCEAGEDAQAKELMVAELTYCGNYVDLVDRLATDKSYEQAEHWAREGFAKTIKGETGTAWQLAERLFRIAKRRRNKGLAAALRVDAFVHSKPSIENYLLVRDEAKRNGLWAQVGPALLRFLETGKPPSSATGWPLPDSGLKFPKSRFRRDDFPNRDALVDVALHEKRPDDALRWFRKTPFNQRQANVVAKAVQKTHPEASLDIWRTEAEALIAKVDVKAYRQAMPYLQKVKKLLHGLGRSNEYDLYVAALRRQHKAKRRLMADLDALENRSRRIVDG